MQTTLIELPKHPRYPSLDLWRGLACLMVVVFHSSLYMTDQAEPERAGAPIVEKWLRSAISMLWTGVPMFFVISGYCIAATCDSARRRPAALTEFFKRRFRRIYPPYWIFVGASLLLVVGVAAAGWPTLFSDEHHFIPHPETLTLMQWTGNLTLTERWRFHLGGDGMHFFIGPAWSLCYEEQFYLVSGLLLVAMPARFFRGIALISLLTIGLALLRCLKPGLSYEGFFFDGRWLLFAAGMLVYYRLNYRSPRQGRFIDLCLGLSVIAALGFRYWFLPLLAAGAAAKSQGFEFVVGAIFALSLSLLHPWDDRLSSISLLRPLARCGRMCYSLYLVHWPVSKAISHGFHMAGVRGVWPTLLIVVPLATGVSLACAWLFHRSVERRYLNSPLAIAMLQRGYNVSRPMPAPPAYLPSRSRSCAFQVIDMVKTLSARRRSRNR